MLPIRRTLLGGLFAWVLAAAPLLGADRVFLLPSGGSTLVTALDAADLSVQAAIPANFSSFKILSSPAGDRYFILTRSAQEAVIVVDGTTLEVLRRVSLASAVSDGDLGPDGQDILLAADKLRVIRLGAEEQVVAEIDVGGGAEQVVVNAVSNQAFVLSNNGRIISVVDLATYKVTKTINVSGVRSIALSSSEDRLVAATETKLLQYRTSDQEEIAAIPTPYEIRSGAELFSIANSTRMFLRNTGSAPRNTSQVIDLEARTVKGVGLVGTTGLRKILIVSPSRGFTIVESTQSLAEVDLDATPNATVTPLNLEISALSLGASPNKKLLYVASSVAPGSVAIVDAETKMVVTTTVPPVPPKDLSVLFGPSSKPAVNIAINSGNNQFVPPGTTTPNSLSVLVTDADGAPLFGVPVLFAPSDNTNLKFTPGEIVMTNTRGIASVLVSLLAPEAPAALGSGEAAAVAVALEAPAPALDENPLQPVVITATTSGGPSVDFTLNIILGKGLIKISGDYQITEPRESFPLPFLVLATDKNGRPLPKATNLFFAAAASVCGSPNVPVDINGFASVSCVAEDLNPGGGTTRDGSITVSAPGSDLTPVVFTTTTAIGSRSLKLEKIAGDNQTAPTGTTLNTAPTFLMTFPGSSSLGSNGVGVEIRQKSGPAASITPVFTVARLNFPVPLTVTLGPRAGKVVIEAVANSPGRPKTEFTAQATGGLVVRFEKEGDGQSARIGGFLGQPLRMRVFNESQQKVPFPAVVWKLVSGDATLLTASDSDGATARVRFGLTPGPVVVQGTISGLVATFNVTAAPPQAIALRPISGDAQTVQVGKMSDPIIVEVIEIGNLPALGAIVVFSGPPSLLFHPLREEDGAPANPLQLIADQNGRAGATVEVLGIAPPEEGSAVAQVTSAVPIVVTAGAFSTMFALNPLGRTPVFETSSISNGATFVSGIVPGSLASLFGVGLSEGVTSTEMAGGVLDFRGLAVKVGGIAAPILTVTRGEEEQINFQVPFQIATGQTTTVEVNNNGSVLSVSGVPVFSSQPGIFMVDAGATSFGAIVHPGDFSLVTPEKPAAKGEVVALFFTGGGLLTPAVATGVPGPVPAAEMALPITAKVAGKDAEISFKGYAPGLLGVYQLNFAIPTTSACGAQPLNLSVAGADSPGISIAVKCE